MNARQAGEFVASLDAASDKVWTACGPSSRMIWRRWGTGAPVILLHGGAGSWLHWIRNIEPLARSRTVWVPDIPGFGDSDLPGEGFDADTLAPLVLRGATEILAGEPFDLVGFSFGGLVAALIAAEPAVPVRRLVLTSVAALGLVSEPPALRAMRGVTDPQEREQIVRFNLNAMMLADPASIDDLAVLVHRTAAPRDRVKNRRLVLQKVLPGLAPRWRCPAWGVWGTSDALYRHQVDQLRAAASALGLVEAVYLDGAGHWLPFERSEQFNPLVRRFLDAAPATTPENDDR